MASDDDDPDEAPPRTVILPVEKPSARTASASPSHGVDDVEPKPPNQDLSAFTPPRSGGVEVGDELNGIYRIVRRIGAGGMGEVFEGLDIEDGQHRVAIKVMLPSLAADPDIEKSFKREVDILRGLSHPALVKYLFMARDRRLGVLYMVTEFIDGAALEDLVGTELSADQLITLTRRLAEGLKAAHEAGVDAHRDMSPDNVLLPSGRMEDAKIVDFGIAKTADPKKGTIVSEGGFAGKLGFAAPEQFGAHGGVIGPWTDVYSLGLVILTLAQGKSFNMGATLAEAVQRRETVPDLSGAPGELRNALRRMLAPNPSDRARSMDEVLHLVPRAGKTTPRQNREEHSRTQETAPPPSAPRPMPLGWIAGVTAVAILLGVAALTLGHHHPTQHPEPAYTGETAPSLAETGMKGGGGASPAALKSAVETAVNQQACTWVSVTGGESSKGTSSISLQGVSQDPIAVERAAAQVARGVDVDTRLVWAVPAPGFCAPINSFRGLDDRDPADRPRLSSAQSNYTVSKDGRGLAAIQVALRPTDGDFALLAFNASETTYESRQDLQSFSEQNPTQFTHSDATHYSVEIPCTAGLQGVMILVGSREKLPDLSKFYSASRGLNWSGVAQEARNSGVKVEVVWFKVSAA